MFKIIPGNHNYKISLSGEIVGIDGQEGTLPIEDGKVWINLFGKDRWVDLTWLSLIAYYEVFLTEEQIFNINFTDTFKKTTRSVTGKVMVFLKPMLIDYKYRIIPNFTQYAISKKGELIRISDKKIIVNGFKTEYPSVFIYVPEKNRFDDIYIHRLVALAWIKNDDYYIRCTVNHIDGNKQNFHYRNLEWVSYLDNNLHAINAGLRTDNRPCKIRDIYTKEVMLIPSMCQAAKIMKLKSRFSFNMIQYPPKLFNSRYEVKLATDDTPWFYEDRNKPICRGRYIIDIVYPDGKKETYYDVRTMIKELKVYNIPSQGIETIIEYAYKKYPELKITYTDLYPIKPVQAMNIKTGEVLEAESISEMAKKLNMRKTSINYRVKKNDNKVINGHVFRYKSDDPWNTVFTHKTSNAVCLLATNSVTNEQIEFPSLKKAARYFNCDKCVIIKRLKDGSKFGNWTFKEI